MQEALQLPVSRWIMRSVHGLVVLVEKLRALPLRQVPENDLRVVRVLSLDQLSGHEAKLHRGSDNKVADRDDLLGRSDRPRQGRKEFTAPPAGKRFAAAERHRGKLIIPDAVAARCPAARSLR
jgi:hypothetical protein